MRLTRSFDSGSWIDGSFPVNWSDGIEKDVCLASSLRMVVVKVPDKCVYGLIA